MSEQSEWAEDRFLEGFVCAQAVFMALARSRGLPAETAARIAGPLGGGLVRSGEVCGALTGALLAIGLARWPDDPVDAAGEERARRIAQEFTERFRERHGSLRCRDLLGVEILTPEGRDEARRRGLFVEFCPRLVGEAVELAEELLGRE